MENYDLIKVIRPSGSIPGELSRAFWSASSLYSCTLLRGTRRQGGSHKDVGTWFRSTPQTPSSVVWGKEQGQGYATSSLLLLLMQGTTCGVACLQPHKVHLMTFDFRQTYLFTWSFSFSEKLLLNVSKHLWVVIGCAFLPPWITESIYVI